VLLGATARDVEGALDRARAAQLETPMTMALALAADLPGASSTSLRASPFAPLPVIDAALLEVSRRLLHGRARMSVADLDDHRRMVSAPLPAYIEPERSGDLGEFIPNDESIIDAMLELAGARSSDVLYDLGCGDGRVLVRAAQRHGLRAIGIEWDADRVELARRHVQEGGVSALVEVRRGDVNTVDAGEATIVYSSLRDAHTTLIPRLRRELRPGTRLVSRDFDYGAWPPEGTDVLPLAGRASPVWLFRWSI
jgi:SAM-dependent methyltransferase